MCPYCKKQREDNKLGWHTCPEALKAEQDLGIILETIHEDMKRPGYSQKTSAQLKNREHNRQFIATQLKLKGRKVHSDYA